MTNRNSHRQGKSLPVGRATWSTSRALCVFAVIVLGIVVLDQVSKYLVRSMLAPGVSVPIIPHVFDFTLVYNEGAAFGVLQGAIGYFVFVAAAICIAVICYLVFNVQHRPFEVVTLSMVVAGAIGNLIDRLFCGGAVTDFIATAFMDFPVFNVADIAVTCGCILFIANLLFLNRPQAGDAAEEGGADAS